MLSYKNLFLLDPSIIYLNHGSFGACPRQVFETYQVFQRQLERQPVEFLGRKYSSLLDEARHRLAEFLNATPGNLIFFPNPTTAVNMVTRNIERLVQVYSGRALQPGDEILSTDHEYGALNRTWKYICTQNGLKYINQPIPVPLLDSERLVEQFWAGVNDRTRIIFISHITSPTGLIFPIHQIARKARAAGILMIVDGAHAPGQIHLDLEQTDVAIYAGACHKWLMAPKGSAFLYAKPEFQEFLDPLVVSWGYDPEPGYGSGNTFFDRHEWQGTRDIAAFLAISATIEFQQEYEWDAVRRQCHQLAVEARSRINQLAGGQPICSEDAFQQMFAVRLPPEVETNNLIKKLYNDFHIEVPAIHWNGQDFLRVSIQGYNSPEDIDSLINALEKSI